MAEQLTCNQQVDGSTPFTSSSKLLILGVFFDFMTAGLTSKLRISLIQQVDGSTPFTSSSKLLILGVFLLSS